MIKEQDMELETAVSHLVASDEEMASAVFDSMIKYILSIDPKKVKSRLIESMDSNDKE